MGSQGSPGTAFILSLIGGILMLVSGGLSSTWFMSGAPGFGGMMGGGFGGMMGGFGVPLGFMGGLSLLGLVSGIIVIIGALMLNTRPAEHTTWGTIILIFSIISLLGMGGFFVGAILGIVGGALALSWRPSAP
ncbi:MAG: DUF6114 domain-containing protein [Thaumarchaeota archaeon]|nr:DUF6114 domain-containing protein [Nitrososphaerota archaeon]